MSRTGDPAVQVHLERTRALYDESGAIVYIQDVVTQTWRANRRRWSPTDHFDDTNTLGYQTSRNVNNRIHRTIETSEVAPSVHAQTELGVVILGLGGYRLRVVKAPIESGLAPDFDVDFDWTTSATREAAARRNSNHYYPLPTEELALEFEDDPRPSDRRNLESCRDLFLLWAAELKSDRTAGWLGLPRLGDVPWMGVHKLWLDEPTPEAPTNDSGTPAGDSSHADEEDEDEDEDG
jgi:hypothetical protein